uniref:right-handed parallel beta-helix repeat-containing protein n=1 Tax=Methanobrevibacter sp. TaxID=66852 RepID=UPI00386B5179
MIKKINIFLVLLLLLISIGAVSAADEGNMTDIVSSEAIQDTIEVSVDEDIDCSSSDCDDVVAVDSESSEISAATYTIDKDNYNQYFDSKTGELKNTSGVKSGDAITLSGDFSKKDFIFNQKVNIVGSSSNLEESRVILLSGASGSTITNLKIVNTKEMTYGIFLNSTTNCTVSGCNIYNTGKSSYCICLGNGANYNNITNNTLETYGVTYGHNQRSTPPLVISGSHHNIISDNNIKVDDANGIYLSAYAGGPLVGGESNYNVIRNNIINYKVLPTSWSWGIQIMGSNNKIENNIVNGAYRGISTTQYNNRIINNTINGLTGADYNDPDVEVGGEYGIVASYNSYVADNKIINAKIISTGAGIYATDGSTVENNYVKVTSKGKGIDADGYRLTIENNTISTESGSGVYQKAEVSGLIVKNNNISSVSGVGILIEKLSSKRMPSDVTIRRNTIVTGNKYAIDISGVKKGTANNDLNSNNVGSALIMGADGIYDASKPTYVYEGKIHNINSSNIRKYINVNGGLTSEVKDGDILNFTGTFEDEVIYITKGVKITGDNPIFKNSTFKVTSGNVLIEGLTIINNKANRVNAWGIYVNQAPGVKIRNNNISVNDSKAAYAIYVLESTYVEVSNNELYSEGDYLTFTLLAYACEDCSFTDNTIHTNGTGTIYNFKTERCIDGGEVCIDGNTYCVDGNELYINGVKFDIINKTAQDANGVIYCIDGNEICIDGKTYCLDCNEVIINGKSVSIDGNNVYIDGNKYCLDCNELTIDGVTYCIDGNAVCVDGVTYCADGNEASIYNRNVSLKGNNLTI